MKKHFISVLLALIVFHSQAQQKSKKQADYQPTTYHALGVSTNTNAGLLGGFAYKIGKLIDTHNERKQYRYMGIELVNTRHLQEVVSTAINGNNITYGKQNYLFSLRPQYGREISLFQRSNNEGIHITGILAVGPSIGLVKPYYIQYAYKSNLIKTEPYDPAIHTNDNNIVGTGSLFSGIGSIKPVMGGHLKAALGIDLDNSPSSVVNLEIGFLLEAFSEKIILLPAAQNYNIFTAGYITLYVGSRK
jgi:hypothetical protein